MTRTSRGMVVAVAIGSLIWTAAAVAQTQAPASGAPAAPAAMGKQIEGQVKSLDPTGKKLTLADGTEFTIPAGVKVERAELAPGAMVRVAYEEQNGQKILKQIHLAK